MNNISINRLIKDFKFKNKKTIGKEFRNFIEQKKDEFDDFSILENEILSLNEFLKSVDDFIVVKHLKLNTNADITKVHGTDHLKYIGISYLDMLEKGLKMDINIPLLLENPVYYYETQAKNPTIYYTFFNTPDGGEVGFVDGDGNHRTCLAKVIEAFDKNYKYVSGITKVSYKVDYAIKAKFSFLKEELNKLGYRLNIKKEDVGLEEDKNNHSVKWRYKHKFEIAGKNRYLELNSLDEVDLVELMPLFKKIIYKVTGLKI